MESQRPGGAPFITSGQLWPTIQVGNPDSTPIQLKKYSKNKASLKTPE